jgi:hypothetical protein
MKKQLCILIVCAIFTFVGCADNNNCNVVKPKDISYLGNFPYHRTDELHVVVIDSCEYIVCNGLAEKDVAITHKGNCSFCKIRNKK